MTFLHYLFFALFSQSIFIIGNYLAIQILFIYFLLKTLIIKRIKKYTIIFLYPFIYWLINLFIVSNPLQLLHIEFYRYDGKFIPLFVIFLLLLNTIHYRSFNDYIKKIKYLVYLLWFITLIGFFPPISLFDSHNANAGFIGSIILINLIIYFQFNHIFKFNKIFLFLITLYFGVIFIMFFSRAFFLALIISVFFFIIINKKSFKRLHYIYLFTFLLIFLGYTFFLSNLPDRFLIAIKAPSKDWNVIVRILIWKTAINLWTENIENFLFGIGIGQFNDIASRNIYNDTITTDFYFGERHSHNIILHLLVEQGILGLILFFWPFIYIYKKLKKYHKLHKLMVLDINRFNYNIYIVLFLYLFIASQFGLNFFTPSTSIIFYILITNIINSINLNVNRR
jgi:O-antigen ligase